MSEGLIRKMFGTSEWPIIDFDRAAVLQYAQKATGKLSISGVQPKLSMKLNKEKNQLESVAVGGEFILKPSNEIFPNLPENEQCCMDIAETLKIDTPPHCLLPLKDNSLGYLIKRFDREHGKKIHQEEFSQILGREKYIGSVEQIGKAIREVSTAPGYDVQLFFERVLLNFILGNADAHLKNYTMRYKGDERRLAPAYDIVCSKLAIPSEELESALDLNGKRNRLKKIDFDKLAENLKVPEKIRYETFEKKFHTIKSIIENSRLDKESQFKFISIVSERFDRLELSR